MKNQVETKLVTWSHILSFLNFLKIDLPLKQLINLIQCQPQAIYNITGFLIIFADLLDALINNIELIDILSFSRIIINQLVLWNICHLLYEFYVWNFDFPNSLQQLWAVDFAQVEYSIRESIGDYWLLGVHIKSFVENFLLQNNPRFLF